jgi:hypothetical protein
MPTDYPCTNITNIYDNNNTLVGTIDEVKITKHGTTSCNFDGAGDYISTPDEDWELGQGDFTLQFTMHPNLAKKIIPPELMNICRHAVVLRG